MNASVTTRDTRHHLHMERRPAHPRERVWQAITDPAQLSQWWPLQIDELPQEVGAALRFYEGELESMGTLTPVEPGRLFAFADPNAGHEVRFELESLDGDDGEECLLVFTHSFPETDPPAQYATGWHFCFEALSALLDGREVPPLGYDQEIRERYEGILGTGDGS